MHVRIIVRTHLFSDSAPDSKEHGIKLGRKMLAKIIFLLLFLIITFSSFGLCIRNENLIDVERRFSRRVKFFPEDDKVTYAEPRQNYGGSLQESKFTFPGKHKDNTNTRNDITTGNRDIYSKPQANTLRENPYDAAFNTGEHYPSSNSNNYPSNPNYPNTIFAANGNGRDVPNYQTYNDPNYLLGNYAQNFDYLHSNRPSFNRAPNYSSRPITQPPFNRYQYQSAPPYPGSFSSPIPQGYPPIHGGQFNGFQLPFSNPLANFFNNFRAPSGQFSEQFTKALEDIARNDDLQCVPKLLCQMVGDKSRRKQLPEFISAPAFTSLIAAVPSTSPTLAFGRAALLGFTGGDDSCHNIYSRCPENEDDLLYYLNNHRGGFFRFFNGGGSFGDSINNEHYSTPNDEHRPSNYQNQEPDPSAGSYGFNLSNLGSNLGLLSNLASLFTSANQISSDNYKNGGGNAGNLLTGLVGNYFSSRRISKRSVDEVAETEGISDIEDEFLKQERNESVPIVSKTILENATKSDKDEVEGRILNKKIYSGYLEHHEDKIVFPYNEDENNQNRYRGQKAFQYNDDGKDELNFKFPSNYYGKEPHRNGKRINFEDEFNYAPHYSFEDNPGDRPHRAQMIFPDRTGTGNLRFDSKEFEKFREHDRDQYGKILNRPVYNRDYYRPEYDRDTNRPYYDDSDRYRPNYSSSSRYEYERTTERPNYSQSYYTNRYTTERPYRDNYYITPPPSRNDYSSNRYTTQRPYTTRDYYTTRKPNYSQDYYTTRYTTERPREPDRNIYVTNSKGVVEYYITPGGGKVYV